MLVNPVRQIKFNIQKPAQAKTPMVPLLCDTVVFENPNIDKKPFIEKGIIKPNDDINVFFDKISVSFFDNTVERKYFSDLLKYGAISLSSSTYRNIKNPKSAIGVKLNPKKTNLQNVAFLEQYIKQGVGLGFNLSEFSNPKELIKEINSYFLYRQKELKEQNKRPPAAIGILNVNHPEILNFITLKDNVSYDDWCLDLSVVLDKDFLNRVDNNENITLSDGSSICARRVYETLLNSMYKKGEPGVIFSQNHDYICDCCAAAPLKPNEGFTIAHINLSKFNNEKDLSNVSKILSKALKKFNKNPDAGELYIGVLGYGELLDRLNISYGSKEAVEILEKYLKIIKNEAKKEGIKLAVSPTSTVSRVLKTTPALECKKTLRNYYAELKTMAAAQKYLDGTISKTIILDKNNDKNDIDKIIRYCLQEGIKGISVFRG